MPQYTYEIDDEYIKAANILGLDLKDIKQELDKRLNRHFANVIRAAKSQLVKDKTITELQK